MEEKLKNALNHLKKTMPLWGEIMEELPNLNIQDDEDVERFFERCHEILSNATHEDLLKLALYLTVKDITSNFILKGRSFIKHRDELIANSMQKPKFEA